MFQQTRNGHATWIGRIVKDKLIQAVKDALGSSDSFEQYDSVSKEQYVILINGKRVR
ncbi:hypothetical protein LCGC14_2348450, partial [marine sediment metagenome]